MEEEEKICTTDKNESIKKVKRSKSEKRRALKERIMREASRMERSSGNESENKKRSKSEKRRAQKERKRQETLSLESSSKKVNFPSQANKLFGGLTTPNQTQIKPTKSQKRQTRRENKMTEEVLGELNSVMVFKSSNEMPHIQLKTDLSEIGIPKSLPVGGTAIDPILICDDTQKPKKSEHTNMDLQNEIASKINFNPILKAFLKSKGYINKDRGYSADGKIPIYGFFRRKTVEKEYLIFKKYHSRLYRLRKKYPNAEDLSEEIVKKMSVWGNKDEKEKKGPPHLIEEKKMEISASVDINTIVPKSNRKKRTLNLDPLFPSEIFREAKSYLSQIQQNNSNITQSIWNIDHQEIIELYKKLSPTKLDIQIRHNAFKKLAGWITKQCDAIGREVTNLSLVGSFPLGIYVPGSDIDIVLTIPKISTWSQKKNFLYALQNAVAKHEDYQTKVVPSRNIPILKVVELLPGCDLQFDIVVNTPDGITQLKEYEEVIALYPEIRYLLLPLKTFLRNRELHNPAMGGIGSLLLFSFIHLFVANVRINEHFRQQLTTKLKLLEPVEQDRFGTNLSRNRNYLEYSLDSLLLGFCEFYSTVFDSRQQKIVIHREKPILEDKTHKELLYEPGILVILGRDPDLKNIAKPLHEDKFKQFIAYLYVLFKEHENQRNNMAFKRDFSLTSKFLISK